ncbi:MAG: hypothetical protein KJ905_00135 [Nanoarchaeota archaeon]|nr:hypothetical protein [Nanoarchaeota archaeon]MBU1501169.1 hypothetical protein [Nanoarchaeota archaeon]MBU2458849.1 hypothetical protein [Nanoarchaeota archaeon]
MTEKFEQIFTENLLEMMGADIEEVEKGRVNVRIGNQIYEGVLCERGFLVKEAYRAEPVEEYDE